jgi:hypothetical protein
MKAAGELAQAETLQHKELMLRAVNQLSRTFTAQLEGVKRYLSAPVHNVSVSVAEGGQAIVVTGSRSRGTSIGTRCASLIAGVTLAVAADTARSTACVTSPTIACPPSATDTLKLRTGALR